MDDMAGYPEGDAAWIARALTVVNLDCDPCAIAEYDYRHDLMFTDVISNGFRVVISTDEPRCVDVSVTGIVHEARKMQVMQSWQIQLNEQRLQLVPDMSFYTYPDEGRRSPTDKDVIASDTEYAFKTSSAIDFLERVKVDLIQHFARSAIEEWRVSELTALKAEEVERTPF